MEKDIDDMTDEEIVAEIQRLEKDSTASGDFPKSPEKDSTLKLFRDLIKDDDSKKVTHLDSAELIRTRGYLDIALYAETEGLLPVSAYLESKAENIFATGMSKKGFFAQLLVTQIKKEQKIPVKKPEKKGWLFNRKKEQESEEV